MFTSFFQLSGDLGFQVTPKANLTFNKCLEMNLQDHIGVISKIAEVAGKEYAIEQVNMTRDLFLCALLLCDMTSCEVPTNPVFLIASYNMSLNVCY